MSWFEFFTFVLVFVIFGCCSPQVGLGARCGRSAYGLFIRMEPDITCVRCWYFMCVRSTLMLETPGGALHMHYAALEQTCRKGCASQLMWSERM